MCVRNRKDAIESSILTDSWGKIEGVGYTPQPASDITCTALATTASASMEPTSSKRPASLDVPPLQQAKKQRRSVGSSNSSSSSTACPTAEEPLERYSDSSCDSGDEDQSGSESDEDTAALRNQGIIDLDFYWVVPTRGLIHVSSDLDDLIPICSSRAFITDVDTGKGFLAASRLGRSWCPRCLARRADLADEVMRDATYLQRR